MNQGTDTVAGGFMDEAATTYVLGSDYFGAGTGNQTGISTFYGMILATVVGILFIPALYAMFQRYREWVKGLFAGKAE